MYVNRVLYPAHIYGIFLRFLETVDGTSHHISSTIYKHRPLTRYAPLRLAHAPGMLGTFPRHRLQRKPLVSDPGMHHGTCVTHVPWCMSGSLTRNGGENVPGIPGACATRNFAYLVRGPWLQKRMQPTRRRGHIHLLLSHRRRQNLLVLKTTAWNGKLQQSVNMIHQSPEVMFRTLMHLQLLLRPM